MLKYNKTTKDNLEKIVTLVKYKVRYERGVFQSDSCIILEKKVVVINKFLPIEGKINVLIDIIHQFKEEIAELPLNSTLQKTVNDCWGELNFAK